jgi:hypothetical protein
MINITMWQCPKELIEKAIIEHPIAGSRTALNTPTGDFFYDKWKIKDEFKGTAWEEVLKTLPYTIGEARVITLEPNQSYMAHADIDNRWHLNLTGRHSYLVDLDSQKMYKQNNDGHWRYMFADKIHTAGNYGSTPRKQLVVREPLKHSRYTNLTSVEITPAQDIFDYRYQFDNLISPWLNRKNQEGTLDDFVYKETFVSFKVAEHVFDELSEFSRKIFNVNVHK